MSGALVSLDGAAVAIVTAAEPVADVWLAEGPTRWSWRAARRPQTVTRSTSAPTGAALPDTSGNTFSADGTLEYAASGQS